MSERKPTINESITSGPHESLVTAAGSVVLSDSYPDMIDSSQLDWKRSEDGVSVLEQAGIKTTFPPDFFNVDDKGRIYMSAGKLDSLKDGIYDLAENGASTKITVRSTDDGRRFVSATGRRGEDIIFPKQRQGGRDLSTEIERRPMPEEFLFAGFVGGFSSQLLSRNALNDAQMSILSSVGYDFRPASDEPYEPLPTPDTLQQIIDSHGLPVSIIQEGAETGAIPLELYLKSFSEGRYPVGTDNLTLYAHDVRSNDHLIGALLLGEEGLSEVAKLASTSLESSDRNTQLETTRLLDTLTSTVNVQFGRLGVQNIETMANLANKESQAAVSQIISKIQELGVHAKAISSEFNGTKLLSAITNSIRQYTEELDLGQSYISLVHALEQAELPELPVEDAVQLKPESLPL